MEGQRERGKECAGEATLCDFYFAFLQLETENFGVYLTGIITLIVEIALSFSVLLVLIYVNPIGAITLLLFFLPISYAFYFFSNGDWFKLLFWLDVPSCLKILICHFC